MSRCWQELVNGLQSEWELLNRELSEARYERDQLSKALSALTWNGCTLTKEEILAEIGKEKPLSEFLRELRESVET